MKIETLPTPRLHYAWVVLVISTLVIFGSLGLARFGYTVVLPMQTSLGMDNTEAGMCGRLRKGVGRIGSVALDTAIYFKRKTAGL